jgi:hypothetical protein
VNITLDPHIIEKARKFMAEIGETSFSSLVEGLIDCVVRETCEGCPAYEDLPESEKAKIKGKVGAGKQLVDED